MARKTDQIIGRGESMVLMCALHQAARWKLLLANPAEDVDLPRQQRRGCTGFDVAQAKQFIKAISGASTIWQESENMTCG